MRGYVRGLVRGSVPGFVQGYLAFLRRPYAGRLLGATLLGRLPNGMGMLAVVLHIRDDEGGYPLAGTLAAILGLATSAGQPVLGRAMDRFGQPRVLLPAAAASAAGFGLLAAVGAGPLPVAIAAVVVAGFATPPLEAGLRALWPDVLDGPEQVDAAYALDAAAQELLFTVGPLLVVAAAVVNTETALLLTGGLGIAGTLIVALSGPSRRWTGEPRAADWAGPLRSPGLRVLLLSLACAGIALGVYAVAVVAYAEREGTDAASGLLLACMAAGALIGGIVYGARRWAGAPHRRLPWLLAALAAGYVPLVLAPGLAGMSVLAFLSGVFLAPVLACSFTLVDRLAPSGTVTEAFAWVVAAVGGGASVGSFAAGLAQDLAGVRGAFAGAGVGGVLALALCLLGARTLRPRTAPAVTAEAPA
ncbi:putative MFS family arabinose efflux permease [Actinomadura pelletieri DSM 43383]|uniref:Putative MFS family arabinose efflux permease n=1 Tax=Actinomadura pelletieri DSM 43383 TaxID=1120940 RepID=A0A495QJ12_9ACTN|nr:MFS transporter [Actinomadura pelletieri]RKS72109.1 putative MFS family arabinose efflux permease [Actinomadura pelletieri DSM 43383]